MTITILRHTTIAVLLAWTTAGPALAAQDAGSGSTDAAGCPMHAAHSRERTAHHDHLAGVNARGDHAMGFSHAKTTHRFRLFPDGGAIEVSANDAADAASRDEIRSHLRTIAKAFAEGVFDVPAAVHDRVPPGVPTMKRRKAEIAYRYEQTERGAVVRITTANRDAVDAIHDFLRFQIEDHRTGDPTAVGSER